MARDVIDLDQRLFIRADDLAEQFFLVAVRSVPVQRRRIGGKLKDIKQTVHGGLKIISRHEYGHS